jgi:hypothetical protein
MAFTSQTFSALEQPTLAKWNILSSNDDDLNARIGTINGFTNVWWEELGRTTLGGAGDTITVNPIGARKYLRIIISVLPSGAITANIRFNNDSANNYAYISTTNGSAGVSVTSTDRIVADADAGGGSKFVYMDVVNISATPKLASAVVSSENASGAATAPNVRTIAGKWHNTSAQITRVDCVNTAGGDFAIGSELIVLGHD